MVSWKMSAECINITCKLENYYSRFSLLHIEISTCTCLLHHLYDDVGMFHVRNVSAVLLSGHVTFSFGCVPIKLLLLWTQSCSITFSTILCLSLLSHLGIGVPRYVWNFFYPPPLNEVFISVTKANNWSSNTANLLRFLKLASRSFRVYHRATPGTYDILFFPDRRKW